MKLCLEKIYTKSYPRINMIMGCLIRRTRLDLAHPKIRPDLTRPMYWLHSDRNFDQLQQIGHMLNFMTRNSRNSTRPKKLYTKNQILPDLARTQPDSTRLELKNPANGPSQVEGKKHRVPFDPTRRIYPTKVYF